jgi:histidinol-phosphate aminotransferase
VLVHFPDDDRHSAAAADAYLSARGYILRRVAGYGFPDALRMTVGTEEANRGVVAALGEFLKD